MHPFEELITKSDEEILDAFHNKYGLKCKEYLVRLMECEYYPWDDVYTHRNERQKEFGKIYVHRQSQGYHDRYKAASFRCFDITCHGGILVRSIQVFERQEVDGKTKLVPISDIIDGPCCSLDYLLNLTGWSMEEFESQTQVKGINWPRKEPIFGCRVGLSLLRAPQSELDRWAKQLILPRRSSIYVSKKERKNYFAVDPTRQDIKFPAKNKWLEEMKEGKVDELSKHMSLLQVVGYYQQNK